MTAINQTTQQTVVVEGDGETKQQAFASALTNIQKQLIQNQNQTVLQIEPLTVTAEELQVHRYTEKFLFFFFKRVRTHYHVKLSVTVAVNWVDLATLNFTEVQGASPDALSLPNLKHLLKGAK